MLDRVMLTNDDGIDAPGMQVLEEIAAQIAREVWVVAPEHDQSGQSHAISLHHALRISERGERRFGVTGTPGDCAAMGLCHIMKDAPPQLVLSGVNRGLNLGMETVFSGTVGGAMTAMMLGVPALALSQAFTQPRRRAVGYGPHAGRRDDPAAVGGRLGKKCRAEHQFPADPGGRGRSDDAGPPGRGRGRRHACGYPGRSARNVVLLAELQARRHPARAGERLQRHAGRQDRCYPVAL